MGKPIFSMNLCKLPTEFLGEYFKGIHWGYSINELLELIKLVLEGKYKVPNKIQIARKKFLNEYYHNADGLSIFRIIAILNYIIKYKVNSKSVKPLIFSTEFQKEIARSILLKLNNILKTNLKNQSKIKYLWEHSENYFNNTSINIIKDKLDEYLISASTIIECIIKGEYKFKQKDYGIEVVFNESLVGKYFTSNANIK